jgi:phosphoribosylanthranilate isomerase
MKIKICGLTNVDDAFAAIEAGADYLGFVFYPHSPRYVAPADCARIMEAIDHLHGEIKTIGVFVDESLCFIREMIDVCGLDLVQLHGDESPRTLGALAGRAYKGIRPRSIEEAHRLAAEYASPTTQPVLLLDTPHEVLYGGTGRTGDWSIARHLAQRYAVLLAGGLKPENVGEAIRQVQPWGVDVASGVESAPGRKDRKKLIRFARAAREAIGQPA